MTLHHVPSYDEQALAKTVRQLLENAAELQTAAGSLTLTPALSEFLQSILERLGNGESLTVFSEGEELSTQQAADLLGVSRPYLIEQLLEKRRIPYRKVGKHRRILLNDLLAHQQKDLRERQSLSNQLTKEAQDMGLA